MSKLFILYDGRAKDGDAASASILCTAASEREAREDSEHFAGVDAVWFEYDTKGRELINERIRPDLSLEPQS